MLAIASLASCEKEPEDQGQTPEAEGLAIVAVTDGTLVPEWVEGDKIKVSCGDNSYDYTTAVSGKSAQFTGDGTLTAEIVGTNPVTAFFNCSSARGAFRIAGEQTYAEGKSSALIPMYAYTMNTPQNNTLAMTFKPLASVLRVTLPVHPINVEKIIVKAHEGATVSEGAIAGTYTVNATEGTVSVNNDAEMVELEFGAPLNITSGGSVDIPVGWFAVSGGLDVTLVYESVKEMTHTLALDGTFKSYVDVDGFKAGAIVPVEFEMDVNSFPRAYYVTADASANGKGVKWSDPATLDYALEYAMAGSVINLAAGTYKPTKALPYTSEEEEVILTEQHYGFEIKRNIKLVGGYPTSPSEGAVSDPSVNKTILDGDNKSWHVVVVGSAKVPGEKVEIEGLTITHGYNLLENNYSIVYGENDNQSKLAGNYAAGIALVGTDVELRNVVVTGNQGENAAGLFAVNSKVTMDRCEITENTSNGNGAGVWVSAGCDLVMDRCVISKNNAGTAIVGGLYLHAPEGKQLSALVKNTSVTENSASNQSGVYVRDDSGAHLLSASFVGCTFSNNIGGMASCSHHLNANVTYDSCTFSGNKGTSNGVVNFYDNCNAVLNNCTFELNETTGGGGAIYVYTNTDAATPIMTITNSIFHSNKANGKGTVWLRGDKGQVTLNCVNNTFYANQTGNVGSAINLYKNVTANIISNTIVGNTATYAKDAARAGAICLEAAPLTVNAYNNIVAGNIRSFDSATEDVKVKAGTITNKYSFIGNEYYDVNGTVASVTPSFDYVTMVGAYAEGVVKLTGSDNPALTYGMPASELKALANDYVSADILGKDQLGNTRNGAVAGACVAK